MPLFPSLAPVRDLRLAEAARRVHEAHILATRPGPKGPAWAAIQDAAFLLSHCPSRDVAGHRRTLARVARRLA